MKFFCVVWIWICLSGFGISATDGINLHGYTDASVTISCSHRWAESNLKYFCRDPCNDRNILVKSGQSPKGRFRLKDFGNGTFTVTISELQLSDSGVYWCGVERSGKDTYNEVNLKIHKGPLVFTAVGLTVTLIIFGVVLCVWNWQKKKSHSSSGPAHADAELKRKDTTCTTEAAGDYEEIRDTQQQTKPHTLATIYSTVYTSPGGNQIQDPPLCSTLSDQPESYTNQTPNSSTNAAPSVTYASIKIHTEGCGPNTRIRSEDTVTYDTVYFPKDTF
ncbi:uncharacterized protein LOC127444190 isoform X2 [Myxocyprinus asiaticus]|uniref:uncharacterized protein LOC127444190 isoform X2 n=1 Tax=Myxocyprinus asiaticus TaxID=70543 RepID=UPI002222925D|nr:uncharacterized protein LOC127444190 isoform X2 [Myxocyprinus asiaticus]